MIIKQRKNIQFMLAMCLSAFATMYIIASSGVYVSAAVSEFDGFSYIGLVFTLESLARTLLIPISGKLGDRYGRKPLYLASILAYISAALIYATSVNIHWFLLGRILMGSA